MKIPGLSFSWKRAVGISALKQKLSRAIGIPMTKQGLERKIGGSILKALIGKKWNSADNYSHFIIFLNYGLTRTMESFFVCPTLRNFAIPIKTMAKILRFRNSLTLCFGMLELLYIFVCFPSLTGKTKHWHRAFQRFRLLIKLRHFGSLSADSDNACVHWYWYMVSYPISGHEHCCLFIRRVV